MHTKIALSPPCAQALAAAFCNHRDAKGGRGVMLVADLHIHTKWSDGRLSIPEVVDLFGRSRHDVIAITDHIVNGDNVIGRVTHRLGLTVTKENFDAYRAEVEAEARRRWDQHGM